MTKNLEIGTTIGDYQVIGILGAGGMGKVYKVRNVISDRVEALKVLLPDLATEPDLADRFVREIKVQASLEHPNIASLHTALRVENQLLMLMEFVEGMTLDQKLKAGPLPISEAVEYVAQVLGALGYAHQHGVIHRDIKPANMMLTPSGVIKLMDFGIAKAATDRKLTMTGTTMGSLYYMSPEQIKGAATLDARSDLYSIGVTLYELVTGKRPFDGDSQFAIMAAHLEKNPIPPITLDPRLPAELNDIILLSVAKDPAARFQTAEAFRNALLNIQGLVGRPAGAVATARRGAAAAPQAAPALAQEAPAAPAAAAKGHRGIWIAAGTLFTALLVIGIIQFGPWKKTSAGSAPPPEIPAATAPVTPPPPAAPALQPEPPQPAAAVAPVVQTPAATVGDGGRGTGDGVKPAPSRPAPVRATPVVSNAPPASVAAQSTPPAATNTSPAPASNAFSPSSRANPAHSIGALITTNCPGCTFTPALTIKSA
jgi:serine/threonine-protein kinase